MKQTDHRWIDPPREVLQTAIQEAVDLPEDSFGSARFMGPGSLERYDRLPEGRQSWILEERDPTVLERVMVRLAWWSDYLHCRHVRLCVTVGAREHLAEWCEQWDDAPALLEVYPSAGLQRRDSTRADVLLLCPCGAMGTIEEIGWMGRECGPCHDRRTAEELPSRNWEVVADRLLITPVSGDLPLIHFTPDYRVAIQATRCVIWNPRTGRKTAFRHPLGYLLACSSDGTVLLAIEQPAAPDEAWLRLQPAGSEPGRSLRAPEPPADGIRFSPSGRYLSMRIAPDTLPTLLLWDLHRLEPEPFCEVRDVACWDFAPDGSRVYAADSAGTIHERRLNEGDVGKTLIVSPLAQGSLKIPRSLRVLPDQNLLVLTHPAALWLLDGTTGQKLGHIELPGLDVRVQSLAVDPSGRLAVVMSLRGPLLTLVDLAGCEVVAHLTIPDWVGETEMAANEHWLVLANSRHARIFPWPPLVEWFLREVGR